MRQHRRRQALSVLLLATVLATVAYSTPAGLSAQLPVPDQGPASSDLPWLTTDGSHVRDGAGRTVLLRGFNDDALVSYPAHPPAPLDERDALLMQRSGFNVVRLGVDWAQLEPTRGHIDAAYLDRVADAVRLLNRHGLYAVLNIHIRIGWSARLGGSGAPGWAAVPLLPNWTPLPGQSWGQALSPAVAGAYTYFWLSPDWQRDFELAWQALGRRFRDASGVAGYDLYNEPHPIPFPPGLFEKYWMWPFYEHVIAGIGGVDPNHLFFVEGVLLLGLNTLVERLKGLPLVYAEHVYEGSLVPPAWNGDPRPLAARYDERASEAASLGAPLWIGEIGVDMSSPTAIPWTEAALDNAERLNSGWAWWQWRENRRWGIRDAGGSWLNLDFLRHLARPYLAAAPPDVRGARGDGLRGTLTFSAGAGAHASPVVVSWPALTLAAPVVSGDCVTASNWSAATSRLSLTLAAGTSCSVRVTAG